MAEGLFFIPRKREVFLHILAASFLSVFFVGLGALWKNVSFTDVTSHQIAWVEPVAKTQQATSIEQQVAAQPDGEVLAAYDQNIMGYVWTILGLILFAFLIIFLTIYFVISKNKWFLHRLEKRDASEIFPSSEF